MTRMEEIKARAIAENPERKKTFDDETKRLKTAVLVVELRERHELSQRELAQIVGVPKSTIARIENAQVNTSVQMLERIAAALDKELKMSIV
ncbi:helix-turn-helix domain-containing protein [Salinicoccus roseus]|uniref:helix-turn-helix domain-containing protein n=1 Tax=Salinicoccus roseus TaxID=45670 RepID=UPI001EF7396F|nr:helix-turn-helix domain-containing protein [Salinicoccus roseus]MCG7333521.1 helix-turn-helix domain-containing protein [Salinicoccus roseus]